MNVHCFCFSRLCLCLTRHISAPVLYVRGKIIIFWSVGKERSVCSRKFLYKRSDRQGKGGGILIELWQLSCRVDYISDCWIRNCLPRGFSIKSICDEGAWPLSAWSLEKLSLVLFDVGEEADSCRLAVWFLSLRLDKVDFVQFIFNLRVVIVDEQAWVEFFCSISGWQILMIGNLRVL